VGDVAVVAGAAVVSDIRVVRPAFYPAPRSGGGSPESMKPRSQRIGGSTQTLAIRGMRHPQILDVVEFAVLEGGWVARIKW